jgi:hypothetical protein
VEIFRVSGSWSPHLDFIGIRPDADGPVTPAPRRHPQADSAFSDLGDQLPHCERLNAYFHNITVPGGVTIASGESAWFVFGSWRVGADVGECSVAGATFDMLPTNSTGSGGGISWGDAKGQSAAVVVGVNLGLPFQTWASAAAHIPAIETSGFGLLGSRGNRAYLCRQKFPSGTYADANPSRVRVLDRTLPLVRRCPRNTTIDVALVMRSSYASAGTLIGEVAVDVLIVPSDSPVKFTT